jgi:ABC-2 type transport system permease protein
LKGEEPTEEAARHAVARGDFQFCILIAPGTGEALRDRMRQRADGAFVPAKGKKSKTAEGAKVAGLTLCFDPAVQGAFRTAVSGSLQRILMGIELKEESAILGETFTKNMKKAFMERMGPGLGNRGAEIPDIAFRPDTDPLLELSEEAAGNVRMMNRPTAAQQNVPAWTLFGMFFIVVPLSGTLIRERQTGTFRRLMTMPVSRAGLLAGKVAAYVLVCLAQFVLMLAAGVFALPALGVPGLLLLPGWPAVLPIALAAALAATGYGILVGALSRSYEQASMFGAVSVVIAAALGGIMIPAYVMPRTMQEIGALSPLAWGLGAFQEVFVRGGSLRTASCKTGLLLIFFALTMTIAWLSLRKSRPGD